MTCLILTKIKTPSTFNTSPSNNPKMAKTGKETKMERCQEAKAANSAARCINAKVKRIFQPSV